MKEKLEKIVRMLREIDDEMENEICIKASVLDDDFDDEFSFWGIADMIEEFTYGKEKENVYCEGYEI